MSSFLQKYKRQPKLFIDLPSQGKWYNDTIIQDGKVESMPVFGMTAMDEILLKTPDALFSGEATAQVIQSCIPNILDPWRLVGYDIDFVLIAIRIATYGETLPVVVECPKCTEKSDADVNVPAPPSLDLSESFKSVDAEVIASKFRFAPHNAICYLLLLSSKDI